MTKLTKSEAREIAREVAVEQIQVNKKLLADPMDGCSDLMKVGVRIERRQRIIEAGMLLAALPPKEPPIKRIKL